ncbi:uncharacterized protein LOC127709092 [Mytilus californianus]|uniref:uncharacterized protein LOC127709092 n=1 Tax=Mytilus californianus TaxID=6549 RepID=UPI00224867FD|nr:uncharacterized protein LOC127709092 [Mytilus californianus]
MLALVLFNVGFALVAGTLRVVPEECYPVFSCSRRFLDVGSFFYDGDTLKDVSEETVDKLCQHLKTKTICKEADKCKDMHFVIDMMAEIETAVCVQYKRYIQVLTPCYNDPEFRTKFVKCVQGSFTGYSPNTCGFVDSLKNCASMFQQCKDAQYAFAVQNMLDKYGTTLCNLHKFNIGAI